MSSRQVRHLIGGNCLRTPTQMIFQTAKAFDEMRWLRNQGGTWMRIYFQETAEEFLASVAAIGEAMWRRSQQLEVTGIFAEK